MWLCCKLTIAMLIVSGVLGEDAPDDTPARCTKKFCEDLEATCPELPPNCTVAQPDFFGWETESPDICNCCPFCMSYLGLNDICSLGQAIGVVPTHICGPGLYCYSPDVKSSDPRCKKMVNVVESYLSMAATTTTVAPPAKPGPDLPQPQFDMECSKKQYEYDLDDKTGNLGNLQLRPECDGDGLFASYKCVPGELCYCQDEFGERIFGEIPFTPLASILLHCSCSRHNAKAAKQLDTLGNTWIQMRCLPDGSYDPIQCIEDACLCVDRNDGIPTYPNGGMVNVTAIEEKTIACFDNKTHKEFDYYHECEDIYNRDFRENLEFLVNGYDTYGAVYPKCQMDGWFERVQQDETEFYCAYPNGTKIDDYSVPLTDPAASEMNCNCARTNLLIAEQEKPVCCPNGNYKNMQCRRGECRCVDENGNQIEKEVPMDEAEEKLSCYNDPC